MGEGWDIISDYGTNTLSPILFTSLFTNLWYNRSLLCVCSTTDGIIGFPTNPSVKAHISRKWGGAYSMVQDVSRHCIIFYTVSLPYCVLIRCRTGYVDNMASNILINIRSPLTGEGDFMG